MMTLISKISCYFKNYFYTNIRSNRPSIMAVIPPRTRIVSIIDKTMYNGLQQQVWLNEKEVHIFFENITVININ